MTFIGPKPEPVEGPKVPTPITPSGHVLRDANGRYLGEISATDLSVEEDQELAKLIADAMNVKFGGEKPEAKPEPKLRTLIAWSKLPDGEEFVADERSYEVAPGVFRWSTSRKAAENIQTVFGGGWTLSNEYYRFVDVESGEEVS